MLPPADLRTGDLVLFYNPRSWLSWAIGFFGGTRCSHVGMVVRDPCWLAAKGTYLLQSGEEPFPDAEDHRHKTGVSLVALMDAVAAYPPGSMVHVRQLRHPAWAPEAVAAAHAKVHDHPYDYTPSHWLRALVGDSGPATTNRFWCSALVAFLYIQLGVIDPSVDWTYVTPKDLRDSRLPMKPGNSLGAEVALEAPEM